MAQTGLASVGATVSQVNAPRERLLVSMGVVRRASLVALVLSIVLIPSYWETSPWIGVAIAATIFVVWHGVYAAHQAPWLPGAVAFGACVQWVLAPWAIYSIQGSYAVSPMAVPAAQYFSFAVPCTLALVTGLYLPLWRRRGAGEVQTLLARGRMPPGFVRLCEFTLWGALGTRLVLLPVVPAGLRFATYLVTLLALVAVLCQMLLDVPGWRWRSFALLAVCAVGNAADLQFLEVLLVALCLGATYYFRYRPRLRMVLLVAVPTAVVFLALSAFKAQSRDKLRRLDLSGRDRAAVTGLTVFQLVKQPSRLFAPEIIGASMNRLNEGWVISRVLAWVPYGEPFAEGETVVTAVRAAFLPRLLDPGKYSAGGAEIVPRFTGLTLIGGTSIGLSVPGEMYANFGPDGAWIGTLIYGLVLGLVYRAFLTRARHSVLWLAWVPFVYFGALSVEPAIGEVLNHISKSLLVMWAVVSVVPQWRQLRRPRRPRLAPHPLPAGVGAMRGTR